MCIVTHMYIYFINYIYVHEKGLLTSRRRLLIIVVICKQQQKQIEQKTYIEKKCKIRKPRARSALLYCFINVLYVCTCCIYMMHVYLLYLVYWCGGGTHSQLVTHFYIHTYMYIMQLGVKC